ncbi:hypothetical protein LWF01_01315 [Saxibacter everestensis]|uniref:Potassium transporter Trk n=1 Tax=Saxibacter everestensis TaxID=2909229 RepID=A0ABY8QU53_9MICO|nr:hypothetical protein LWF01_01315 [Brevibacteriaceae bacterium ZFBP1038]
MKDNIEVRVRRAPKYGVFVGAGVLLGVVAALLVVGLGPDVSLQNDEYSPTSMFALLGLGFGIAGALLGGLVAIVLDRLSGRRTHTTEVTGVFEETDAGSGVNPGTLPDVPDAGSDDPDAVPDDPDARPGGPR